MNEDRQRIEQLEKELDETKAKMFDMESRLKRENMIRFELEEVIRNIFYACHDMKKSEDKKPDLDTVLSNLAENIRKMAKDYNISL